MTEADVMELDLEQIRTVIEFASLAPSVHNTQPWHFVAAGHTLEVRADTARSLHYLDPAARQLHISCGAAIELARLGVRALGYDCVVRLAPRSHDEPTLLATMTAGHAHALSAEEVRLIDAVPRRYTDRGPYDDRAVDAGALAHAAAAAADRGCWMRVIDRPGDRVTVTALTARAEAIEAADPGYQDELATWRRRASAPDGVPTSATIWPADSVTDVPLRDFSGTNPAPTPDAGALEVERDCLVLLGSDDDTPVGWLRTGRALALMLLTLTDAGVTTQPLGPITDVELTRERLQRELGLLGHPQMLLRVGYGHGRPRAGRRNVEDVLSVATTS